MEKGLHRTSLTNGTTPCNGHTNNNNNNCCSISSGGANGVHGGEPQCGPVSAKKPGRAAVCFRYVAVTVIIAFLAAAVAVLWYYMGWSYGLPALIVAVLGIVVSRVGWRWFYIAAVTTPRDVT